LRLRLHSNIFPTLESLFGAVMTSLISSFKFTMADPKRGIF